MKKSYITLLGIFMYFGVNAQTAFHKYFEQEFSDGNLYRCIQTSLGDFVAVGRFADASAVDDFIILKTDPNGNPAWIKKITGPDAEEFTDVIELAGGELVAVGSAVSMSTFMSKAVVVKFDVSGNRLWYKTYTIPGLSSGAKKVQTDLLGNIYVLGSVDVSGSFSDYFIMKLDANGNITQQTTFGTPDSDFPLCFLRNANGDFFIGGWENSGSGENIHLIKVSAAMTVTWSKLISGTTKYFAYEMREKSNGNIVLAGRYDNGVNPYGVLIFEVDPLTGSQVWAKSYDTPDDLKAYAYGLAVNTGDVLAITGVVEDLTQGTLITGTDPSGVVTWSERIGAPVNDYGIGYGINKSADGGYIVCGPRGGSNNSTVQLLKTGVNGDAVCNTTQYMLNESSISLPMQNVVVSTNPGNLTVQDVTFTQTVYSQLDDVCSSNAVEDISAGNAITVYPNPSPGKVTISFPAGMTRATVNVYSSTGGEVYSASYDPQKGNPAPGSLKIDLHGVTGVYFVRLDTGSKIFTQKIIIQ